MAASKIGDVIARRAKVVVIIVLVLTILFGASASQMQFETEENSFNPDNEVARTQGKISDDFGSEGIITQAVAISNNDNILSRNALLDVLSYEWELENRMVISETLLETPMGSIMGPPDLVFFLMGMLSGAEQSTMALTAANTSIAPGSFTQLATLVEGIEQQIIQLESVMNSTATQTVKQEAQDNFSLALSMQLSALPSLGQESPPPPSGNEISLREQQLMWLDSTTDQEIKDLMIDSAAYDNTDLRNLGNWTSETYLFASIEAASAGEAMTNATLKLEFITTDANYTWSNATSMVGYSQMVTQLREGMNSTSTSFEGLSRTFLRMPDLGDQLTSVSGQLSSLLSKDFTVENGTAKAGLIIIYQDGELPVKDLRRAQQSITDMANDFKGTDVTLRPMAMFIFMDKINDSAQESMITLIPIALLFIIVVLIVNYHSVRDMVLSLMTLLISLVWVFGIAVQLGYEFNIILVAVPVLIGGLGIDYAIHLIMRYREELRKGNNIHKAAATSVMMVGGALALTTITTVIGFMSNTTSSVKPIRDFGSLSALGIICSLVVMLTFIPAIKVISDERRKKKGKAVIGMDELDNGQTVSGRVKGSGNAAVNKFLGASATASEKHPLKVLAVVVIVTSFCAYGSLQLETEFDILDFLPKDLEESKTIIYLMDNFAFSESYAYIYITGDMADDGILNAIDITARQARDGPGIVSNVMPVSPTSVIQDMYRTSPQESGYNQTIVEAIESRDNDGDGIPESDLTNLYDIIRQNDSAWSSLSFVLHYNENGRYDSAVIRMSVNALDDDAVAEMTKALREDADGLTGSSSVQDAEVTGEMIIHMETMDEINANQVRSIILTIILSAIVLTIILGWMDKSLALGPITMMPIILIIIWMWGSMFLLGFKLNVMTNMIAAISIGLGLDYAIHVTHRFKEEIEKTDDVDVACREAVIHTGSAITGAAVTTMGAFAILGLSSLTPMRVFGQITALAVLYGYLSSIFVLPTLLVLWAKSKQKRELRNGKKSKASMGKESGPEDTNVSGREDTSAGDSESDEKN